MLHIVLGIADGSHSRNPESQHCLTTIPMLGIPKTQNPNSSKFPIFALPHMGKRSNLVAPLFTKETTPVSHVRKASKTPFGVHLANVVSKPWRELLEQALEP